MRHTLFVHFFAVVLHDYDVKLLSYMFYGGTVVRVLVYFFFALPLILSSYWWSLAFLIFSPPLQNFQVVLPTKKCLPDLYLSL